MQKLTGENQESRKVSTTILKTPRCSWYYDLEKVWTIKIQIATKQCMISAQWYNMKHVENSKYSELVKNKHSLCKYESIALHVNTSRREPGRTIAAWRMRVNKSTMLNTYATVESKWKPIICWNILLKGSQLSFLVGHEGPKRVADTCPGPNKHHFPICFYVFWNRPRANHEELAGLIWPVGHHLRTPDINEWKIQ